MTKKYKFMTINVLSGTGNSLRAAYWLRDLFGTDKTTIIHIAKLFKQMKTPTDRTITGIIFPTHGFTAPWAVIRHVLRMPSGRENDAFIIASRAGTWPGFLLPGLSANAMYLIAVILLIKGYRIKGLMGLDMPSNWMSLHWGISAKYAEKIISRGRMKIERFSSEIFNGRSYLCTVNNIIEFFSGIILLPVSAGYLLVGRFTLAKLFYANFRCTSCGICVKECPFNAIVMKGGSRKRPYWTFSCESCMHCMAYCPEKAVEASHPLAVVLFFISTFSFAGFILVTINPFPSLRNIPVADIIFNLAINYIYILAAVFCSYLVFYYLVKIPFVNRIFTYTTLTHYYRRYHEPSIDKKDFR